MANLPSKGGGAGAADLTHVVQATVVGPAECATAPSAPSVGAHHGGQPGHEGHGRVLRPVAQVDRIVDARPAACGQCGAALTGDDAQPARHQVAEVPRVEPEVTE